MKKRNYLEVDYDKNYDQSQENEESWISSVLGTQDDTISDVIHGYS